MDDDQDEYMVSVEYRGFVAHLPVRIDSAIPGMGVTLEAVADAARTAVLTVRARANDYQEMQQYMRENA